MARRKKPKRVDIVEHVKSGVKVEIKLDPDSLKFVAEMPDGETLTNKDGNALKTIVYRTLVASAKLEWQDVIQLERLEPFHAGKSNFIGFNVHRFHWARKPDGYVRCDWLHRPDDERGRLGSQEMDKCGFTFVTTFWHRKQEFKPPLLEDGHRDTFYLVYTEEMWTALNQMIEAIGVLRDRLDELVATPEGHEQLMAVGDGIIY